jgi:hypothetical protein
MNHYPILRNEYDDLDKFRRCQNLIKELTNATDQAQLNLER